MSARNRWTLIGALVVIAAIGVFLWNARRTYEPRVAAVEEAASLASTKHDVPAPVEPEAKRESVEVAPTKQPIADQKPSAELAADQALLRVHTLAKETGEPIGRVRVFMIPDPMTSEFGQTKPGKGSRGSAHDSLITPEDGWVEFVLPAGQAFRVCAATARSSVVNEPVSPLAALERRELTISLQTRDDKHHFGRVVAASDGTPIDGAEIVKLDGGLGQIVESDVLATTRRGGAFDLDFASWSPTHIAIRATRYATAWATLDEGHDSVELAREYRLELAATANVRVIQRSRPVVGASVSLETRSYNLRVPSESKNLDMFWFADRDARWNANTDANGTAVVHGLPPTVQFTLSAKPFDGVAFHAAEPVQFTAGETRELTIDVAGSSAISGRIIDQRGNPVASYDVWMKATEVPRLGALFRRSDKPARITSTDEQGRFELSNVGAGEWSVGPAAINDDAVPMDQRIAPFAVPIKVEDGGPPIDTVIHAWRGLTIEGRVEDAGGAPSVDGWVTAFDLDQVVGDVPTCHSREDGSFVLGPLPDLSLKIKARAMHNGGAPSEPIVAHAGDRNVVIRMRAGASISGRTIDARTRDPLKCHIELHAIHPESVGMLRSSQSGVSDTFKFDGLVAGSYEVVVQGPAGGVGVFGPIDAIAGRAIDNVEVLVAEPAHLTLHYVGDADVWEYAVVVSGVSIEAEAIKRDIPVTVNTPSGKVTIRMFDTDERPIEERTLDLVSGQTLDLVFGEKH